MPGGAAFLPPQLLRLAQSATPGRGWRSRTLLPTQVEKSQWFSCETCDRRGKNSGTSKNGRSEQPGWEVAVGLQVHVLACFCGVDEQGQG